MSNIITLKTGVNLRLEWNFLVLEYLEEREGSLNALEKRINAMKSNKTTGQLKLVNSFIYAVIQANHEEVLTYKQTIKLVDPNDYDKIFRFIVSELEKENDFKKKGSQKPRVKSGNHHHKSKKK